MRKISRLLAIALRLAIIIKKRVCFHRFDVKDVCNLNIDPKCEKCGKLLSELS